ncbi:MAG: NAD(P)-dependent glycerol-1-phosphate dehydrogenase [Hadesarchaea archaeon]|nr:NAD(P)-dependent glycerol-1-phosphate dehydrogenase [Hadesarchaea archaeon]
MKEPKRMELPREVWMGPDVLNEIPELCKRLSLKGKALVIADKETLKVAGEKIIDFLTNENYEVEKFLVEEAKMSTVNEVRENINGESFLLGVGGGTCIDVAKFASFKENKSFISVPTAASHDGISSSRASIKGGGKSTSFQAQSPLAIVADTLIIKNAPSRLLAAGCGDMISNYTAVWDWEFAKREKNEVYSEYAAALSKMSSKLIMKNAELISEGTEESARKVVKALISSGVAMSIAGSSRPASGSEHLFSHALDQIAPEPALHGEQCGVGSILMAHLQENDWKSIRNALKKVGCPTNAKEMNIKPKHIIEALTKAHEIRKERYTILRNGIDKETAEELARKTGVI